MEPVSPPDPAHLALLLQPGRLGQPLVLLVLCAARPLGFVYLMPLFGRFHLNTGYLRGAVMVAMIMPLFPAALAQLAADPTLTGDIIDMQRGASMAQLIDPGSGGESSVTGTLLLLVCLLLLAASGALAPALFGPLFESYRVVPLFDPLPPVEPATGALALGLLDTLLRSGLLLALPLVVPLLLVELGIVIATKYLPQLNAMFLSMSVKQGVHAVLLAVSATLLAGYALDLTGHPALSPEALRAFLLGTTR
ncbi:MAG: hypothetical protein DI591_13045 [Citromicrobium sp.]|nr:MAG: hypothetical protein DI591_13045 [Citromicrobium sp.]